LQRVKEVLLDDEKRKIYDETGEIPGEDGMGDLKGAGVRACVCVFVFMGMHIFVARTSSLFLARRLLLLLLFSLY
jgi:DnaJ-class molecular chaperone